MSEFLMLQVLSTDFTSEGRLSISRYMIELRMLFPSNFPVLMLNFTYTATQLTRIQDSHRMACFEKAQQTILIHSPVCHWSSLLKDFQGKTCQLKIQNYFSFLPSAETYSEHLQAFGCNFRDYI